MQKKTIYLNWIIPILVLMLVLVSCGGETTATETPVPEQPESTATPVEAMEPTPEPEMESETGESDAKPEEDAPEISQPIARWNAVSEQENWVLIGYGDALNPTVVEPGTYVTINFSATDDQVIGSGGCNSYFTSYTADDDGNLTINGPVGSTMMACEIGMEQETTFLSALETVTNYTVTESGTLLLDYDSGTVYAEQLVFLPEAPLVDTVWFLTAYGDPNNPTPVEPSIVATAIFSADGTLSGNTGCNNYIATYTLQDNQITVNMPAMNLAACELGVEQEQAFMIALGKAQSYRMGLDALEITSEDGFVLRFSAQHLSLENVRWLLASVDGQAVPEGVSANVTFTPANSPAAQGQENSVNGSAGCNTFFGPYTVSGDTLTAGPLGLTQMMCEDSAMQVEQAFLAGLESAENYQVTGNQLTITTASGSLLFYADRLPLEGTQWILTGIGAVDNPQPPFEGIFTAAFSREFGMPSGVKFGETGCNNYTATYFANAENIKVNLPQTSQTICSDAQSEAEQGYFLGLNAARDYHILGTELYVYYDNSVLIFVGSIPEDGIQEPSGPLAPLNGTQWWLIFIDATKVIPESEVTILFEINSDGRTGKVSGSGGCNNYSADIADVFTLWPISVSKATCDTPEGIMEQEAKYLNALQNANGILREGNQLIITTSNETLYFSNTNPKPVQPTPTPGALVAVVNAPRDAHPGQLIKYKADMSTPSEQITSYRWWFTGGDTAEGLVVERTYEKLGAYDAILTISNTSGETAEASVKTKIHPYLIGSSWVLDGTSITLKFSDGVLSGNAGCNDFNGGYTAGLAPGGPNELAVETLAVTNQTCDDDVMNREEAFLTSLQTATSYTIDIYVMTVTTESGKLVFDLAGSQ